MTDQHPITPPPELVQKWRKEAPRFRDGGIAREDWLMDRAAQWGADQELEACLCEVSFLASKALADRVRAARRPKPPSLKEQALADFDWLVGRTLGRPEADERSERIRRALEQLNG